MELNEMSITELKAMAFDLIVKRDQVSRTLQLVNEFIEKKASEAPAGQNAS